MPYLTTRKNLKLQLSPCLVASYDIQPGNGVSLFWDTKHTRTHMGDKNKKKITALGSCLATAMKKLTHYYYYLLF